MVDVPAPDKPVNQITAALCLLRRSPLDNPPEAGRASQCKIHYGFAPSPEDGVMYMATHLSGPPIDRPAYSPWYSWHDDRRCFRGAGLVAYDTGREEILWWDTLFPKEGCRCLLHDPDRRRLYAIGYPRDHLWSYDLASRTRLDLGRIGSVNAQTLFLDRQGRVWTSSDYGRLVRYDPDKDRMEMSPYILPHDERYQTGWHSVLYDAVSDPDGECVYAVTWIAQPRLIRIRPEQGEWGDMEDLGPLTQDRNAAIPMDTFTDHCGGLVFGADRMLYFVASRWSDPQARWELPTESSLKSDSAPAMEGVVTRMDPGTGARDEVAVLERPEGVSNYVSRGAIDANGDLFFGLVNHPQKPNGVFRVRLSETASSGAARLPLRLWG